MTNPERDKKIRQISLYLIKFGVTFCVLYFGSRAIIGLSTPGNYYSPFVAQYLDYTSLLRASLLYGSKGFLSICGYHAWLRTDYILALPSASIRMVYSCLGIGIMSFWTAFVFANKGSFKRKTVWIISGLVALWCINILRVSLLLMALQNHLPIPFGWDHHTWFNIVAYALIFLMIYLYDRSARLKPGLQKNVPAETKGKNVVAEVVNEKQTVN